MPEVRQAVSDTYSNLIPLKETWLIPEIVGSVNRIPGYTIHKQDPRSGRAGCVIICHNIFLSPLNKTKLPSLTTLDGLWLVFPLRKLEKLLIVVASRLPTWNPLHVSDLKTLLSPRRMVTHSTHLLITADFD